MKHYKIAFCGLGSIAKRHIRNLSAVMARRSDSFEIDLYRSTSGGQLPDGVAPLIAHTFSFSEAVPEGKLYDAVFITNPTSVHLGTMLKFKNHTKSFFIEKPISDTLDIEENFFRPFAGIDCYVACPLRYSATLQYVKSHIDCSRAIAVRAISSSYLPDWRPGQDYRRCYSAHREQGGGVGIDLIHEWDYLSWLFGMPTQCRSVQGTLSGLEIDSDDLAIYVGRNERTAFEVHLDYFGRATMRECDIFLPDETLRCDIKNGRITYLRSGYVVKLESDRDSYQLREIEHFLDIINHQTANDSTAEHAFEVLKIAKGQQL